jgi:hypothetical protein
LDKRWAHHETCFKIWSLEFRQKIRMKLKKTTGKIFRKFYNQLYNRNMKLFLGCESKFINTFLSKQIFKKKNTFAYVVFRLKWWRSWEMLPAYSHLLVERLVNRRMGNFDFYFWDVIYSMSHKLQKEFLTLPEPCTNQIC